MTIVFSRTKRTKQGGVKKIHDFRVLRLCDLTGEPTRLSTPEPDGNTTSLEDYSLSTYVAICNTNSKNLDINNVFTNLHKNIFEYLNLSIDKSIFT